MLTYEEQEAARQERLNEVGTEPPCPFCGRARVNRPEGKYIRCNPCGVNWLDEEMHLTFKGKPYLEADPRLARREAVPTVTETSTSAEDTTAAAKNER